VRDDPAADADLPGRVASRGRDALPAAAASAAATANGVPGRQLGPGWNGMSGPAASASATAAAAEPRGRARLSTGE